MNTFNLKRLNEKRMEWGENPIVMDRIDYPEPIIFNEHLINSKGEEAGTKGDMYHKKTLNHILQKGNLDRDPRPVYEDEYKNAKLAEAGEEKVIILENGEEKRLDTTQKIKIVENKILVYTKAHTISRNDCGEFVYDLSKGECPLITLRPTAIRAAIAEIIWIYLRQSNDLVEFDELLGKNTWEKDHKINNWWEKWALRDANGNYILNEKGHPIIGATYGEVIRRRDMFRKEVVEQLRNNPDGRRNICSLWQIDDYKEPHGLKPCAFMTIWNIRRGWDGKDYLDMSVTQRSSDYCTASTINQIQYMALMLIVARELNVEPGIFIWKPANVQIYDRHLDQAIEMMYREPVTVNAGLKLDERVNGMNDVTPDDFTILSEVEKQLIKKLNPQLPFPLAI